MDEVLNEIFERQEELKCATIEMMTKRGGSFVRSLAECFRRADWYNFKKLKAAFPQYWAQYEEMAKTEIL